MILTLSSLALQPAPPLTVLINYLVPEYLVHPTSKNYIYIYIYIFNKISKNINNSFMIIKNNYIYLKMSLFDEVDLDKILNLIFISYS